MKNWKRAQAKELECWSYNKVRISHPAYMRLKREYWNKILMKMGLSMEDLAQSPGGLLEVGCGPTGVFILLENKKNNFAILDPLLDEYKNIYKHPFLATTQYSCPLEDMRQDRTFDIILVINAIDHCRDIKTFLEKLRLLADKNAVLYVAMNTHKRRWTAGVWRLFQPILEPHHPFHFTQEQFADLLTTYFKVQDIVDIEDEVLWINNQTSQIQEVKNTFRPLWKKILSAIHPGHLFFMFLEKIGLPDHDFDGSGDSLYRHKMFILKR